jgi:hypothetical protein
MSFSLTAMKHRPRGRLKSEPTEIAKTFSEAQMAQTGKENFLSGIKD